MKVHPASDLSVAPEASTGASRRQRITAASLFVALACSGATSCSRTQIALSSTAIAAAAVAATVGITYAVKQNHHTVQGCVFSDANGLKLRTSEAKVYTLKGDAAGIKVGENEKFHGSKVKKAKGDPSGDQVFEVQKLSKDYGPCPANVATSSTPAR